MRPARNCLTVRLLVVLILFVALTENVLCQQSQAIAIQRDPSALATITHALTAMGLQPTGTLPNGTIIGNVQIAGSVAAAPGSQYPSGTFNSSVQLTSSGYEVRNEFDSNDGGTSVFVSGHGTPGLCAGTHVRRISGHVTMIMAPSQLPVLELFNAISNPAYQATQAAAIQIGTISALHVHLSDNADSISQSVTSQDWYFDPATGLPVRWQFPVPDTFNAGHSIGMGEIDFSNYQQVNGLLLPGSTTYSQDGKPETVTTINSVQFNVPITTLLFDLPPGAN